MPQVRHAMKREPHWCFDDEPIDKVAARMRSANVTCLPVVDRTLRLVGMLSIDDLAAFEESTCGQRKDAG